jgi:hypothetical protein
MIYSYANASEWPSGKTWAYNCAKTGDCNIIIDDIEKEPKLFIGKSVFNNKNRVINIADKDNKFSLSNYNGKMVGVWGENWTSRKAILGECRKKQTNYAQNGNCNEMSWSGEYDSILYAPSPDDGNEIFLNKQFKNKIMDGGDIKPWRHTYDIAYLIQAGKFKSLKIGLVKGAEGKWLKELQADTYIYKSGSYKDYQAYSSSLNVFYPTIFSLLEAHIILQRKGLYTEEEFNLVHKWLEKRVWALEQGPLDGLVSSAWGWKHFFEPANHESINKRLAYMLWGIADQNDYYFKASMNGFEDVYSTMRENGTFKNEHKKGNGANYGISSGNKLGQAMVYMAIILHNQGFDIKLKYPKIEKFVEWAIKSYNDPKKTGYTSGGNSNLRFLGEDPQKDNTLAYLILFDKVFGTNHLNNKDIFDNGRAYIPLGISDANKIRIK